MRYVFSTSHDHVAAPDRRGLDYVDIWFLTEDGVKLHGWLIPGDSEKPLVVLFHGNAANITHRIDQIACLHSLVFPVFIFDYRGFGESEGRALHEEDLYRDARGALDYLGVRGWQTSRLIYLGSSMGAAVALQMGVERPPSGVVLESPFTSLREIARHMTPITYALVGWWGIGSAFDNLGKIGNLNSPLLILHGDQDNKVPLEMSRQLFAAARDPKTLVVINGAGHSDLFFVGGETYKLAIQSFRTGSLPSLDRLMHLPRN
jgi:pimeloyl-ACP methyl ester carboxylesterase